MNDYMNDVFLQNTGDVEYSDIHFLYQEGLDALLVMKVNVGHSSLTKAKVGYCEVGRNQHIACLSSFTSLHFHLFKLLCGQKK